MAVLKIVRKMSELRFSELMEVYLEGNMENGAKVYSQETPDVQLRNAEMDFYYYLDSVFFRQEDSFYAIWEAEGRYVSALRLEPYADGFLLCALETAIDARGKGYATLLVIELQKFLKEQGSGIIYSHISKKNLPSLAVHKKCGFQVIKDHAVYSDGSVLNNCYTLACKYEKSEI